MTARRASEAEILAEFADALVAAGFRLRGAPVMDGRWHRAAVEGDKGTERAGRYRGYLDGIRPAGFIENFRDATRTGAWKYGGTLIALAPAEAEAMRRRRAENEAKREREKAALALIIAAEAARRWKAAPPALACHPYLTRKRIQPHGARVSGSGKLLVPMHDLADGRLACLQEIAPDGGKLFAKGAIASGRHLLLGALAPGAVLLIAEGFADAATLHEATGLAVAVAFSKSNLAAVARAYGDRFAGLRVGVCGDNDHEHPRRDPPLPNVGAEAAEAAAREVGGVAILPPELPERVAAGGGTDWNDVAVLRGLDAVRAEIETALAAAFPPPLAPFYPAPTSTAAEARAAVSRYTREFLARVLAWHAAPEESRGEPEHAAIIADVGTGKTRISIGALPAFVADLKALGLPFRVLITVPHHKLGGEIVVRLADLGLSVATWRGREAENPETGEPMCDNLPAVRDAIAAGETVEEAACGKPGGASCVFRQTCAYHLQPATARDADVVVAAHDVIIGGKLPAGIGRGFALILTDESWHDRGAETRTLTTETLLAGESAHPVLRHDDPLRPDDLATADLHVLRRKLAAAIEASQDAHPSRAALVAAGLTASDCREASRLEWRRKVTGLLRPGMAPEARRDAVQRCAGNAAIPRLSALWKAAAALLDGEEEACGRIELSRREDAEGSSRILLLHTVRPIAEAVTALPMLLLSATLSEPLMRQRLPGLVILAEVRAVAPHMRLHQILGGFGKTSIIPHPKADEAENKRRRNRIADLRDFISSRTGGARTLVITYLELEPFLAGLPGVEVAHFNAISGRDEWGPQSDRPGVRFLFVIGRPMARPETTRRLAAAMTGRALPEEEAGKVTRGATMRDGTARPIEIRAYADPDLEAVRASITEAELIQAIGRGRGINRTAANPLDVWLLAGDVVVPLPLDSLTSWQDAAPGPVDRMAARGVVLTSPSDAARAYPDVFPKGEKSAREALRRQAREGGQGQDDLGPKPLWRLLLGVWVLNSGWSFAYRPPGRGQQFRHGWAPASLDPEEALAWLVAKLGEIETFAPEVSPTHPPEPPRSRKEAPMPAALPARLDEPPEPPEPAPKRPALPEPLDPPPPKQPVILPDHPDPPPPAPKRPAVPDAPDLPPPANRPEDPSPVVPGWWGHQSPGATPARPKGGGVGVGIAPMPGTASPATEKFYWLYENAHARARPETGP
jgi:putative DNA primase/helicase